MERHSDFSAFYQVFVERSYPNLMLKINKGDTIIDAGANIGMFTILAWTLVGGSGNIIAIEPEPKNLEILRKNIEINHIKNVMIINKALFSKSGQKVQLIPDGVTSKIISNSGKGTDKGIEVDTITLDEIIDNYGLKPVSLKMDIEGAEKYALSGATNTMKIIKYFEGEIHSLEDYNMLMTFSKEFSFKNVTIESTHNSVSFAIKHPMKILRLEYHNRFKATKTAFSLMKSVSTLDEYPVIIFGSKTS